MDKDLQKDKKLISISEAADFLGISIDTVRRWDKQGVLHSQRPNGKNRYFSLKELEEIKFAKPLSISEAATLLKVSATTLRRLTAKGIITCHKNSNNERIFERKDLEGFLNSDYYLRKSQVQSEILKPPYTTPEENIESKEVEKSKPASTEHIILTKHESEISKINNFKQIISLSFLSLLILIIALVILVTLAWILYPEETANVFGYANQTNTNNQNQTRVLGAKTASEEQIEPTTYGRILRPIGIISHAIATQINEDVKKYYIPQKTAQNYITLNGDNNLKLSLPLSITSSELKIEDKSEISNLNANYLNGFEAGTSANQVLIINEEGNIAIAGDADFGGDLKSSTVEAASAIFTTLDVTDFTLPDNSVTSLKIKDGEVAESDLASSAVTSSKIKDGTIGTSDISDSAITSAKISDGTIKGDDLADGTVTSSKISDDTITAGDLSAILTLSSGDFLDLSAITHSSTAQQGLLLPNASSASPSSPTSGEGYIAWDTSGNQLIVYNGSSWTTAGGSNITVSEGGTAVDTTVTTFDFLAADFVISESPEDEVNISIDYTNSGITRVGQAETITGGWTFSTATTTFSAGIDANGDVSIADTNIAFDGSSATFTVTGALTVNTGGTITIGDGGDSVAIDSNDWDISSTGALTGVSFDANGTGNSLSNVENADLAADTLDFTAISDALSLDADLTLNQTTSTWTQDFTGTTTAGFAYNANSLTTGTALALSSTATSFNGELLTLSKTASSGSTAFTSDIANITYSQTFNAGVALTSSGNVLDISRAITLDNTGNTHTISGALLDISDSGTQTAGTLTWTGDTVRIAQNYTGANSAALNITTASTSSETSNFALRVNNNGTFTDSNAFVIDENGSVGIFTTTTSGGRLNFGALSAATGIDMTIGAGVSDIRSQVGISMGGAVSGGSFAFTGDMIRINPTRTISTAVTLDDTGNFLDINRSNTVSNAAGSLTISGDLVTLFSRCIQTAGTCTDTANILSLNQNYSSASGAVIELSNSGTGADIDFNSTSPTLTLDDGGTWTLENASGTDFIAAAAATFTINLDDTTSRTERLCHGGGDAGTGVAAISDCSGIPGDYAEEYGTSDASLEAGDLVAPDPAKPAQIYIKNGQEGSKAWVIKSNQAYQSGLIGVVSTNPNEVIGRNFDPSENPRPITLNGRVPVKVSTENGPIGPGDYITSSSTSGVGMKATKAGPVIGQAMTGFEGSGVGTVTMFVNNSNSLGSSLSALLPGLSEDGEPIGQDNFGALVLAKLVADKELTPPVDGGFISEILTDRAAAGLEVITPKVTTSNLTVDTIAAGTGEDVVLNLTADGHFIIKNPSASSGQVAISFDREGNAFFAGTITADTIRAGQIEGLQVLAEEILTNTIETGISGLVASPTPSLNTISSAGTENNLLAAFSATELTDNSFDAQILGNLTTTGALTVTEQAEFQDKTIFRSIADFFGKVLFRGDVEFVGRPTFNKDTAGFAQIAKGQNKVEVTFEKEYENTPVVNISISLDRIEDRTAQENLEKAILNSEIKYIVSRKSEKGFAIIINKPSPENITFSWNALAVKDAKKTTSDQSPTTINQVQSPTPQNSPSPPPSPSSSPSQTPSGLTLTVLENELGYVRIRENPTTESAELGQIPSGTTAPYLEVSNGWYKVEFNGTAGWISGSYVTAQE